MNRSEAGRKGAEARWGKRREENENVYDRDEHTSRSSSRRDYDEERTPRRASRRNEDYEIDNEFELGSRRGNKRTQDEREYVNFDDDRDDRTDRLNISNDRRNTERRLRREDEDYRSPLTVRRNRNDDFEDDYVLEDRSVRLGNLRRELEDRLIRSEIGLRELEDRLIRTENERRRVNERFGREYDENERGSDRRQLNRYVVDYEDDNERNFRPSSSSRRTNERRSYQSNWR